MSNFKLINLKKKNKNFTEVESTHGTAMMVGGVLWPHQHFLYGL